MVQLSRAVAIPEAQKLGQTVLQSSPNHKVAEEYRQLAKEFEERLKVRESIRATNLLAPAQEAANA